MEDAVVALGELYDSRPEEQKPLEVIEKEARGQRAVAREEKKVAESMDTRIQPDSEEEIQDAHHATLDGTAEDGQEESAPVGSGADSNSDSSVEVLGVSGQDVPEQAPVGGAVKIESPAVDGTSEKSQLGHDVIEVDALEEKTTPGETPTITLEGTLSTVKEEAMSDILGDDSQSRLETSVFSSSHVQVPNEEATSRMQATPTIKLEGPLSTVKEEATSDILGDDSKSRLETSVSSSSCVQMPNVEATSRMQTPSSAQETVDLTAVDEAGASENAVAPNLVKLYVDDQVRRWEQVSLEFVMSPMIEYAWPHPAPNY
ncbi:LOW QUALITY PROTEIN: hypothetical protein PHMEG_00021927 [Phytophthora megakarya]|uniref:Uncharacterized protein n=1 Tax=Phytophthora megakarya TaxID=4795 RepID=A0A225VN01_9STRA|nr:LOW QUALITY PROTEIN: hypothetical protein PHMEG_00021927 [Phytophthora megakarya]